MRERVRRRMFPLIASVGLILIGMFTTTWGPALLGRKEWALPYDLWGTLIATTRLAHGNIGGLYAPPTGLISLPGAAVILVPCAALISALGLSLVIPGPHNLHPPVWLLAGPYQIALCCVTLFAADALAEELGVRLPKRGWLAGAAVCVQPLVLLALPVMLALLPWRRMAPFLVRAALPSVVLLGATAIANWHDTYMSVTSQPNSPVINHPTAWTSLAPQTANHNVAAGPCRLATIVLPCLCALAIRRRWEARVAAGADTEPSVWSAPLLTEVLWWVALTLALRSFFEPVMVSYYPWPPMAVALIPAATLSWPRLVAAGVLAGGLTAAAQGPSHAVWIWWVPIVAGLVILLALARPARTKRPVPLLTTSHEARTVT